MSDMKIKCKDCGTSFVFTESEQKWFEEKGLLPPRRCRKCRTARKQNKGGNENGNN